MNPHTQKVSHLIIKRGFLFTEEKVLSINEVIDSADDMIMLRKDREYIENLPSYKEEHFMPVEEVDNEDAEVALSHKKVIPTLYPYPPVENSMAFPIGYGFDSPKMVRYEEMNVPEGTVALKTGADVITSDGENIGQVERIVMNNKTNYATHFVISRGVFFKNHKLIPTLWVDTVMDETVRLAMSSEVLDNLPDYEEEPQVFSNVRS